MKQLWTHFLDSFNTLNEELLTWIDNFVRAMPNIALAILVGILGYFLSRLVRKYFTKVLLRFSKNLTITRLLANITTTGFLILVLFVVLSILKLERALQSLLATAGVAGLVVGLALQEPIINFVSGIIMSSKAFFKVGDLVKTNDFFGIIESINLRSTILLTFQGQKIVLPNKVVLQNPFVNYTITEKRQLELVCGITYGEDLEKVKQVAIDAMKKEVAHKPDMPIEFFYTDFGDSSINFLLRFWLTDTSEPTFLETRHTAIVALKKAFDENGITIPFPIRTLDFMDKDMGNPLKK